MSPALWGVVAALGWGSADVIGRVMARRVGAAGAMWGLSLTGASVALLALPMLRGGLPHGAADWRALLTAAVISVFAPMLFYRALTLGPMALVGPLSACYPAWVVIRAMIGGYRPPPVAWGAIGLVALGGLVVGRTAPADPEEHVASDPAKRRGAIILALLTSLAFAATMISGGAAAARVGALTTLAAARLTGIGLIAVIRPWRDPGFRRVSTWRLLILQALFDDLAFYALYQGARGAGAALASVTSSGYMVVNVGLAAWLLHERPGKACVAGALTVGAGITLIAAWSS